MLNIVLRTIIEESAHQGNNSPLAILSCTCVLPGTTIISGCVEYVRTGSQ
jgi:hypothetical protein